MRVEIAPSLTTKGALVIPNEGKIMTIVRFEVGAEAPRDARYALVGHFGESMGLAVWCPAGESLPSPPGDLEADRLLWYVEMAESAVPLVAA